MTDSKISALTDGGNLQGADQVAINRGGTSFRAVALQNGWIDDTAETWTYASGSGGGTATFTIAGVDLTAKYTPGTRIKLTQTTVKYFVVAAVSFSTNTTVTITAGSDYTLANAAISANYHSYDANPQGYPGWFAFAPAFAGFSGAPTITEAKFALNGRVMSIEMNFSGTSNAATMTFTAPIASTNANVILCRTNDNSSGLVVGQMNTASASTAWSFRNGIGSGSGGFDTSGTKGAIAAVTVQV